MATRQHWSTRLAFILAASGSAVGLGNLWKFPYITGTYGGGAFVLVYLVCTAIIGFPVLISEIFIGQKAQTNVVKAFEENHRRYSPWRIAGWMGLLSGFLIISFYSVVGGWVLDFLLRAILNQFAGHSGAEIETYLESLFSNAWRIIIWHFIFMGLTITIVAKGLNKGLERLNNFLMPSLSVILLFLLVYSFFLPGFGRAVSFMFVPDITKLGVEGILQAVGHAFFTLSLGMGVMVTYGSYLSENESLPRVAGNVTVLNTLIALIAGIVIFSIVFSYGGEPAEGPTLMFQTLPVLFSQMPGGYLVAIAFFLLAGFAALTSAVSLLEVVVTYWEETHRKSRLGTALICGVTVALLGVLCALSFNVLSGFKIGGLTFFNLFDTLTAQLLLPLGGALISLFFGWVLGSQAVKVITGKPITNLFSQVLLWTTRAIAPLFILVMLVYTIMQG